MREIAVTRRIAAALALAALAVPPAAPAKPVVSAPNNASNKAFGGLIKRFIDTHTRLNPTEATTLGEHRYDALLPDVTAAGRAAAEAQWRALLAEMVRIDRSKLTSDNQVDFAILDNELRQRLWQNDRLQS